MLEGAAYSEFFNGKKDSRNFEYDLSKTDPPESYDWFKKHLHSLGRYKDTSSFENSDQRFLTYMIQKWKEYASTDFFPEWIAQAPR